MKTSEEINAEIHRLIEELPTGEHDSSAVKHMITILHSLDKLVNEDRMDCKECLIDAVKWVTGDRHRIFESYVYQPLTDK
jgi:hypothetical protein